MEKIPVSEESAILIHEFTHPLLRAMNSLELAYIYRDIVGSSAHTDALIALRKNELKTETEYFLTLLECLRDCYTIELINPNKKHSDSTKSE